MSPIVRDIQPGEERIVCSYLDAYIDDDRDIARFATYATTGNHHVVMYSTALVQQPNTHDCKAEEMMYFNMVGGGDVSDEVPEGLVRRVKGSIQLVFQTHWINTRPTECSRCSFSASVGMALSSWGPQPTVSTGKPFTPTACRGYRASSTTP